MQCRVDSRTCLSDTAYLSVQSSSHHPHHTPDSANRHSSVTSSGDCDCYLEFFKTDPLFMLTHTVETTTLEREINTLNQEPVDSRH